MNLDIEDKLEDLYQIYFRVEYKNPKLYTIHFEILQNSIDFDYNYNENLTFNANIDNIQKIINKKIIEILGGPNEKYRANRNNQ